MMGLQCYPRNRPKTVHLTLFTMGKYSSFFLYFRLFAIFYYKDMKNKIGILENDIYLLPIVNSVTLLFCYKCTENFACFWGKHCVRGSLRGSLYLYAIIIADEQFENLKSPHRQQTLLFMGASKAILIYHAVMWSSWQQITSKHGKLPLLALSVSMLILQMANFSTGK